MSISNVVDCYRNRNDRSANTRYQQLSQPQRLGRFMAAAATDKYIVQS